MKTGPRFLRWCFLVCLGVLFAPAVSLLADEPPLDPKLADLIEKVQEQEVRYGNYELLITENYKHLRIAHLSPEDLHLVTEKSKARWRIIRQGDFRYASRAKRSNRPDGQNHDRQFVVAYDGKTTRASWDGKQENYEGLKEQGFNRRPHLLLLEGTRPRAMSLGEFLGRTKDDLERPMVITVEGKEEIDELECVKVKIEHWYSGFEKPEYRIVWLAAKRNYLPVKSVYDYEDSKGPGEEDRVLEWSEFQPGLWIPKKIEIVVNDWDADQGAMVPMLRTDLHVNKIDLKPDYPLTFFQEIKLPEVK